MSDRFLERLRSGAPIVADGGVGALIADAATRLRCPEEANIAAPETVVAVHTSYIRAGAELIETNTFGANRVKLAARLLEPELERINSAGARLAREAREVSGRDVFIAGSIGPLGELATLAGSDHAALYAEQARVLEERGVDLFALETFFDLGELEAAVAAVRSVSRLPIVAMLTFDEEATAAGGTTPEEAAGRLAALGVAAIGTNHGSGPWETLQALARMRGDIPLAAMPNVGLASMLGGRVVYPHATPEYFAEFAAHAVALGARIVGGCCGTTPAQIEAMKLAVTGRRAPAVALDAGEEALAPRAAAAEPETRLARALRADDWVVSVELDPPKGGNHEAMIEVARALRASELVGFVDVNDNPMARARMNALMASVAIERQAGVETIPHLTPRDTTIMGLEGALLGAHAEGVRNVLAVTGDPPRVGDYPGSRGVYEVDSIGLVRMITRLNSGEDYVGRAIDAPTSFFVGVAVNPSADDLGLELDRFGQKVEAGARFAMTQALFDPAIFDAFLDRLGGTSPVPLLVGVWPLRSHGMALRLHNEVPGIVVPDEVLARLREAGADAPEAGLEMARALVAEVRGRAAGIYVIPAFKQPLSALDLLR